MNYIYLNDLLDKYPGKTMLDINDILLKQGVNNKQIKIKVKCRACGCEVIVSPGMYRKQKSFACEKHLRRRQKGKDSVFYNRIKTNCSYCGKDIELIPYDFNKKNSFGDSNHFCSQECYWKFRSEYYRGEKGAMYQHKYTTEQKKNLSRGVVKRLKNVDITNTSIQLKINSILDDLHINYERESPFDYYSCDNFLIDYNLIIEVMGDYWHGNPIKYNESMYLMNNIQTKTILKDKQKKSYIKNHYGYPILYLWETDINKHIDKCTALIQSFVNNKGDIKNYHLFNYSYDNDFLKINDELIIPYQDMHAKQYSHLVKKHLSNYH